MRGGVGGAGAPVAAGGPPTASALRGHMVVRVVKELIAGGDIAMEHKAITLIKKASAALVATVLLECCPNQLCRIFGTLNVEFAVTRGACSNLKSLHKSSSLCNEGVMIEGAHHANCSHPALVAGGLWT